MHAGVSLEPFQETIPKSSKYTVVNSEKST